MGNEFTLLHGTLDLLVLRALSWGPLHGYGIARWIEQTTDDVLKVEEGSLYPALRRMQADGLLDGRWGKTSNGRRARFYELTGAGRDRLERERASWSRFALAVGKVVEAEPGG